MKHLTLNYVDNDFNTVTVRLFSGYQIIGLAEMKKSGEIKFVKKDKNLERNMSRFLGERLISYGIPDTSEFCNDHFKATIEEDVADIINGAKKYKEALDYLTMFRNQLIDATCELLR